MQTFAELRRKMTPPTEAEVVAAIKAEIAALAAEFATNGDVAPFGWTGEAAKRLVRRACAEMHNDGSRIVGTKASMVPSLRSLLTAYDYGSYEITRQAFRADRDDFIDEAADELVMEAERLADYWREHKEQV